MRTARISVVLLSVAVCAHAETIYRYLDDKGGVTYTNIPTALPKKGVEKIEVPTSPSGGAVIPPAPAREGGTPTAKLRPGAPANFPKVDSETQRKRDQGRKQILEDELKTEQKLLEDAKKALTEGEGTRLGNERNYQKYLDRIQGLRDTVGLHEKNVEAIKKELNEAR
jgi:Domain of unknown function (DUF4124)